MGIDRIRFAHSHLDDVAGILVNAHPRAAQYLEQAPALAVLACGKFGSHITYGEVDRFVSVISSDPRLRDVLSAYGSQTPIRKISHVALRLADKPVLEAVGRLDPSTLSQSIPSDSQRVWLDGISKWLRLMPQGRRAPAKFNVAWIARQLGENLSRFEYVDSLIDYIGRGDGVLNERWTFERAIQEVAAWHARLRDDRALRALAAAEKEALTFDTVICKAPLPDAADVDGYHFSALRTLRRLREEGATMHHCVASYAKDVRQGRCAIVSVTRDGVNIATLEINKAGVVAQLKSHCNNKPDDAVRAACDHYALIHWKPEVKAA